MCRRRQEGKESESIEELRVSMVGDKTTVRSDPMGELREKLRKAEKRQGVFRGAKHETMRRRRSVTTRSAGLHRSRRTRGLRADEFDEVVEGKSHQVRQKGHSQTTDRNAKKEIN
uniref:Uncharacterized protein n=1 Tax=Toxoplasma gondii COUG TaxID=1074873 RepID=A0A2G8YA43_TOXGO|nr:hypothetical protein TGCOUG_391760 [Toxoplasma gondii COUG]